MTNVIITSVMVCLLAGVALVFAMEPQFKRRRIARTWLNSHDRGDL